MIGYYRQVSPGGRNKWDRMEPWTRVTRLRHEKPEVKDAPKVGGGLESPPHEPPHWSADAVIGMLLGVVAPAAVAVGTVAGLWIVVGGWAATALLGLVAAVSAVWVRTHRELSDEDLRRMQRENLERGHEPIPDPLRRSRWASNVRLASNVLFLVALGLLTYSFSSLP